MESKAIYAKSVQALENEISKHQNDGFEATLAIVFSSITFSLENLCNVFDQHNIDMLGCTTAGEIVNDSVVNDSIVALLFDLNRDSYAIHFAEYEDGRPFKSAERAGHFAKEHFSNPALIICSGGVNIDAEQIIYGLKAGAGEEIPIFGGLAADDLGFQKTIVFHRHGITDNGIATLVLDNDKIEVKGLATSGWEAIGNENIITKSEGNIVYTINDEPALDVFIRFFGYFDNTEVKGKLLSSISSQYPLQILRENEVTLLRSPLIGNEEDRTLTLAGGVRQGDKFRFSISPGFEVIDQTIKDFGLLHQQVEQADALILFSCIGRQAAFGPLIGNEIKGIYDYWKKPMIGFFTYGEIGPTMRGNCEFHNETCSLVLLKERNEKTLSKFIPTV